jgi:hypothetical protein
VSLPNLIRMAKVENRGMIRPNDRDLDAAPVPPRLALWARITAENLLLRHQLNIARRHGPKRAHLSK